MSGSWRVGTNTDIGPTNEGPPDPIIPNCEDCGVSLEDGEYALHSWDCAVEHDRLNAERDYDGPGDAYWAARVQR